MQKFDWNKHKYLNKYSEANYSYSAFESLKRHYKNYKYIVTEVCVGHNSATDLFDCSLCIDLINKEIKRKTWNMKEIQIVISDCERFLLQRYFLAKKEKRSNFYLSTIKPINKHELDTPMYYKYGSK